MSTFQIPCPVCATQLILDEENSGLEVLCPGCDSQLRLPTTDLPRQAPVILHRTGSGNPASSEAWSRPPAGSGLESPPASHPMEADSPKSPALPSGREKTDGEELKRLAGAAAAVGGAHSFTPEEAERLAAERGKTVLPGRRMAEPPPATGAAFAQERQVQEKTDRAEPGMKRFGETPHPELPEPKPAVITPLSPKIHQQVELGPSRLSGGARTLPQAPIPGPPKEPRKESEDEDGPRGGFRLNDQRTPQMVPQEINEFEADAKEWGGISSPEETARSRKMVTIALATMLLIAGGVGIYVMRHAFEPAVPDSPGNVEGANPMKNVEDSRKVLKRFLGAATIEEMVKEVRHPEITRPRMERFYSETPIAPRTMRNEASTWGEVRIENHDFINNTMELDDFDVRTVALEVSEDGPPKVDWESFVNWSEMTWAEFLKHPPDDAVEFRVSVVADDFYNGAFEGHELDTLCFKLSSPRKTQYEFCYGYCDINSEVGSQILFMQRRAVQIQKLDEKGKPVANCILRLRFTPEGKRFNQVTIEKMIWQGWVQP